jgi:hypothetical protein
VKSILFLLAMTAAAESKTRGDFSAQAEALIGEFKPGARAAPTIGEPRKAKKTGWDAAGSVYTGPFGLKLDASCRGLEGISAGQKPAKFKRAVEEMHRRVQRCAATRVLPATVGLIYDVMPGITVRCDPSLCSADKDACARYDERDINFRDAYLDRGLLFHELLHHTRHVDNQKPEEHEAANFYNTLRDEVYFWHQHCFHLSELLGKMWPFVLKKTKDQGITLKTPQKFKKINALALDVCAEPLRYVKRKRPVFTEEEIESVCGLYAEYFTHKMHLRWTLESKLIPLALDCSARDAIDCPDELAFDAESPVGKALAAVDVRLPPRDETMDDAAVAGWVGAACAPAGSSADARVAAAIAQANGSIAALRACVVKQGSRLRSAKQGLVAGGMTEAEVDSIAAYLDLAALKLEALRAGPGSYEHFGFDEGEKTAKTYLAEMNGACARKEIAGSALCEDLQLDAAPVKLMVKMLMYWSPETL